MQNNSPGNINPWREIPLEDYEQHMSHSSVGQLDLLNGLTKKYLAAIKPGHCLFMGIAGGNGLEHIDNHITKQVTGIDINQEYLDACFKRYAEKISSLQLIHMDISNHINAVCRADFIWAALVLEYAGMDQCFEFAGNNTLPGGHFIVTIQANNNLQTVSPTGIESVKKAGQVFKSIDPGLLLVKAKEMGYTFNGKEENQLPNGKAFFTYDFVA